MTPIQQVLKRIDATRLEAAHAELLMDRAITFYNNACKALNSKKLKLHKNSRWFSHLKYPQQSRHLQKLWRRWLQADKEACDAWSAYHKLLRA